VITNQHVVDGAQSVRVTLWNGKTYDATVVGSDASTDIAVLDVDAPASVLQPLSLGDSSKLEVGDGVVAIGSPFGLEQTVTSGIVSALHRQITAPNDFAIDDAIQTDAAINHGNSGGPLLDLSGRVIGVTSQIESESGGNDGVGFAVSSNTVKRIAAGLISNGSVDHAYLGVATETSTSPTGARIATIRTGTPAADSDLRAGDVVTAVDGETVTSSDQLRELVDAHNPGDSVTLTVARNGDTTSLKVVLGTRPNA
jgi:putative serine protease PepD